MVFSFQPHDAVESERQHPVLHSQIENTDRLNRAMDMTVTATG